MFCDLCPRSFKEKCILTIHMERDHLKLRPLECKICDYKCYQGQTLKTHMLQHGMKTVCKICHKLVTNMKRYLDAKISNLWQDLLEGM